MQQQRNYDGQSGGNYSHSPHQSLSNPAAVTAGGSSFNSVTAPAVNQTRILLLSSFSPSLKTRDIHQLFSEWDTASSGGFKIKWRDDASCWVVFADAVTGEKPKAPFNLNMLELLDLLRVLLLTQRNAPTSASSHLLHRHCNLKSSHLSTSNRAQVARQTRTLTPPHRPRQHQKRLPRRICHRMQQSIYSRNLNPTLDPTQQPCSRPFKIVHAAGRMREQRRRAQQEL